jgi:hypothetical protein
MGFEPTTPTLAKLFLVWKARKINSFAGRFSARAASRSTCVHGIGSRRTKEHNPTIVRLTAAS